MATWRLALLACGMLLHFAAGAQSLYKFPGADGEMIYTDRKPVDADDVEIRSLRTSRTGEVTLEWVEVDDRVILLARNSLYAPVHVHLLPAAAGSGDASFTGKWLVPAESSLELLAINADSAAVGAVKRQRFSWLYGDPDAVHRPTEPYRAPFPAAVSYRISQSWPKAITHTTPDSAYAIDIVMPVGSNVLAARGGVVVEVASTNFKSSLVPDKAGARANLIRVLHDDGTFAIYAHLNWNTIRVQEGDRVNRGQYIADSGNTGFSTGPHLHFAVIKNAGTRHESLPVRFAAAGGTEVVPTTGTLLTAY
ncbi:MAG: M23 family metallopeptidase [Woeseia sp.]|nr:M23 family metallopeptidase [Woeseia sp.]MBT8096965.1 M23 family metallopeptidase [Woeseia sp.]